MARALKILTLLILVLILLVVAAVIVITRVIDPNDFKPQISELARQHANLDLSIEGDLAWNFWPSLGVSSGRIEARLADEEALFAALDSAQVSVAVWPLLFGEVQMDGLALSGVEANLQQTASGANWERIGSDDTGASEDAQQDDPADGGDSMTIPLVIPSLSIENSRLRYASELDQTDIVIDQLNLSASDVALGTPFPIDVALRYQDQADMRIDLDINTSLTVDLDNNRFQATDMTLNTILGGLTSNSINVSLTGSVDADLGADTVSVEPLQLSVAGIDLRGHITVAQLSGKPILGGNLSSNRFNLNQVLSTLGEPAIDTAGEQALNSVGLDLTLSGTENAVIADPLSLFIDSSTLQGRAGITDLDTGALTFDLALDQLRVDDYLPPSGTSEAAASAASTEESAAILPPLSSEPLLPLEDLRSLIVSGKFQAGSLYYDTINVADLIMELHASQGLFRLTSLTGSMLSGQFQSSASLDARQDTPAMTAELNAGSLQIQPLVIMALEDDLFTGVLDTQTSLTASGNSEAALAESFAGKVDITLANGTVRGINLHNTLLSGINDLLGTYQALSTMIPGQESGRLPAELSQDTEVVQLTASARLEKLVAYVDTLNAELRKGSLSGSGQMDLRREDFDFRLGMKSPEISDNPYLRDQTWPLRCEGNLSGDASDWCRHDSDGFKDIARNIAAARARDEVRDRLGIEAEGETTEEVIRDAAEQRAREEVDRRVEEGLRRLFQ